MLLSVLSCSPAILSWGRRNFLWATNNRWIITITSVLDLYRTGWKHAIVALLASFVLSASFYLTFFAALRAIDQPIGAVKIMSVMPIVDVLTALPISISGLGVRERSFDFFIGQLTDIPTNATVTASLIGFMFTLFWGLVGGLLMVLLNTSVKKSHD